MTAINMLIAVVIICDLSDGTEPRLPNELLKTEQTITGKSK
jgi:hypothetical protein